MMPIQLGAKPQPDFTQPIDLMMDCHRRVEHFLDVLLRLAREHRHSQLSDEAREALNTALNYFHAAAPRHTEDEEQSLFPRLRALGSAKAHEVLDRMEQLEAEHKLVAPLHERVDALGRAWLESDSIRAVDADELLSLLTDLRGKYAAHIRMEDEEVFPMALALLDASALHHIGQEMQQRRTLNPGRPDSRCAQRRRGMPHPPDA